MGTPHGIPPPEPVPEVPAAVPEPDVTVPEPEPEPEVPEVEDEVPEVEEEEEDVPVARSAALIEQSLNATSTKKSFGL